MVSDSFHPVLLDVNSSSSFPVEGILSIKCAINPDLNMHGNALRGCMHERLRFLCKDCQLVVLTQSVQTNFYLLWKTKAGRIVVIDWVG